MRWSFGQFALDLDTRQVTRGTKVVRMSPKAFELLALLIERQPAVVSKASLMDHLWPGTHVVEANLSNLVAEIRSGLKDRRQSPKFLRTAHRTGYAFVGNAMRDPGNAATATPVACWIEWGAQRFPLGSGRHVIGRDRDAQVRLDASTVSRRHAVLRVGGGTTVLEDCGSKNGTYVGDARVTRRQSLSDGDSIRIGSLLITYRARSSESSTDTYASRTRS